MTALTRPDRMVSTLAAIVGCGTETLNMARVVSTKRSIVKGITYRIIVMCMDFATIFLFTGKVSVAVGFMIASNVYTTVAYVVHERVWARVHWGIMDT